jgi:hypothetical protein
LEANLAKSVVTEVMSRSKWFCLLITTRIAEKHENGGNKMANRVISLETK